MEKLRLCLRDEPIRGSRPCTVVEAHFQPGERLGFRAGSSSQEGRPGGLEAPSLKSIPGLQHPWNMHTPSILRETWSMLHRMCKVATAQWAMFSTP